MPFSLRLPEKEGTLILILAAAFIAIRLAVITIIPLAQDEAMYAVMLGEQAAHPSIIPTFLGYAVSWKPPLFFWAYAFFPKLFPSLELSYRLPSLIFGLLSIPLLYRILRNACKASPALSFFSILIFIFSFPASYPQTALLQDSMMFFFICASLCLYTEPGFGRWRFPAAGILAAAAFFTKLIPAFIVPALAIGYAFSSRKEYLRDPLFILSLLAVPLSMGLHIAILGPELSHELYLADIGSKIDAGALSGRFLNIFSSLLSMVQDGTILWVSLSLAGFAKFWKHSPVMSLWYVLGAVPLASAFFMPWYFLPIMPAVGFFAAMALLKWDGTEKADAFFAIFMCILLALSALAIAGTCLAMAPGYSAEKQAGLMLAGKENVLVIGGYRPGIVAYKMLEEERSGRALDFGWILRYPRMTKEETEGFLSNYSLKSANVTDGSFSAFFTSSGIFRKDTNITSFDYVALVDEPGLRMSGSDALLLFNDSGILIYHLKG